MPADDVTRRLLASEKFTKCRALAGQMVTNSVKLQELLGDVELRVIESDFFRSKPMAVHIDIAAAVVEAFLDDGADYAALDPARAARLRLVVAGLEYLVMEGDVIPDGHGDGMVDDLAVVRWVSRVAAGAEGDPLEEISEIDD